MVTYLFLKRGFLSVLYFCSTFERKTDCKKQGNKKNCFVTNCLQVIKKITLKFFFKSS